MFRTSIANDRSTSTVTKSVFFALTTLVTFTHPRHFPSRSNASTLNPTTGTGSNSYGSVTQALSPFTLMTKIARPGHTPTHFIQVVHRSKSTYGGALMSFIEIACTGQASTHGLHGIS